MYIVACYKQRWWRWCYKGVVGASEALTMRDDEDVGRGGVEYKGRRGTHKCVPCPNVSYIYGLSATAGCCTTLTPTTLAPAPHTDNRSNGVHVSVS